MASINANFQGFVGGDLKQTNNGSLTFSVAVSNHDKEKTTTWINCFVSNTNQRTFDFVQKWIKKGSGVFVQGGISLNTYTNNQGVSVTNLNCDVFTVDFPLSSGKKDDNGNGQQAQASAGNAVPEPTISKPVASPAPAQAVAPSAPQEVANKSDLPF